MIPRRSMLWQAMTAAVLAVAAGAGCGPCPIAEWSPADGAEYRLQLKLHGEIYHSTLSRRPDDQKRWVRLRGIAHCMAVSTKGDVVAIALTPMDGPNPRGHYYLADEAEIVFVDTETFKVIRRWKVRPPEMPPPNAGGYRRGIARFDRISLSDDGKTLVTYYWKPADYGYDSVVTLWDATSGKPIRELALPRPDPSLSGRIHGENASGLAISPDGRWVALAGGWPIKDSRATQPDGFVAIWRTSDGSRSVFRTKGEMFHWNLCFDRTSTRLAGRRRARGEGTATWEVVVWGVPEGKLITVRRVKGRVRAIARSAAGNAFKVLLADGSTLRVPAGANR